MDSSPVISPAGTRERLTALDVREDAVHLYSRATDGRVSHETVPFQPFVLTAAEALAADLPGTRAVQALHGTGAFAWRATFASLDAYFEALKVLKARTGKPQTAPDAPYKVLSDLEQQALTALPARLFQNMMFADLRRLQVDIETYTAPGYDFCNAERAEDTIILLALRDTTGWESCLSLKDMPEDELLRRFVALVRERDPDVIEGHNLCGFDLPYILARCKRHKVKLALGRDGSPARPRASRFTAGERVANYTRFDVQGRHVVDTLHLVQLYDVSHRDLQSYGLKAVARHFGVAAPERTYVAGEEIRNVWTTNPEQLRAYCLDDVRETEAISRLLLPSYFYQAQLIPYSLQNCVVRGNAARIDALLLAGYLAADAAVPRPEAARPFRGGLTDSLQSGVFRNVWHVDVRSLYPSVILADGLVPSRDSLQLFPKLLAALRRFRLQAKDAARGAHDEAERDHFSALQSSFKILINSFYGYLGFGQATFNDFDMAERVTTRGREILTSMLEFLQKQGAGVIEMDTDGIYFTPPAGCTEPDRLRTDLQAILPPGIEVELDQTFAAMLGYKSKNYALLGHDGKVSVTGAALKSRGLEPFQRRYILELVGLLLTGRGAELQALHDRYAEAIRNHQFPLADFAQREVLSTSPAVYAEKLASKETNRSAAYELALRSGRAYGQGDQVAFYVTGLKKNVAVADAAKLLAEAKPGERDENLAYYLDKLAKLHAKFVEF